jgi:hypothetical protein
MIDWLMYFIYAMCLSITMILCMFNQVLICYVCQLYFFFNVKSRLKSSKELMFYVLYLYIYASDFKYKLLT